MGILQIITDEPGQINQPNVRRVKIISTDGLTTVKTAGYLNPTTLQGYTIYNTDIIDMWYGATGNANFINNPGTYAAFTPSISNGVITLNTVISSNSVTVVGTPTVGAIASFASANSIQDSGYKILFGTSSVFAGGGVNFSFSVPGATTASTSMVAIKNQTSGSAFVSSFGTLANSIQVIFNVDPGPNTTVNYVTFVPA